MIQKQETPPHISHLSSHIFYNILKYIKYILEIEATVYKTFPAEILDGPASAFFFPLADRSIFGIKKSIKTKQNKTKQKQKQKNDRYIILSCATFSHESTSCLHLLSLFFFYKI